MAKQQWTADLVFRKLRGMWPSPAHTVLGQVRNGTGYTRRTTRTADALCISTWPSRGLWIAGVEIKVWRSDWKKELADAEKAGEMMQWCNYWYVAAPAGLVQEGELPKTWGLIEVNGVGCKIKVPAPELTPKPPDMLLLCSILRNVGECYVHHDAVAEEAEKLAASKAADAEYKLKRLAEDVAEFEKASGVKIKDTWNCQPIGEAVKLVLDSGLLYRKSRIAHMRQEAENVAAACREIEAKFDRVVEEVR